MQYTYKNTCTYPNLSCLKKSKNFFPVRSYFFKISFVLLIPSKMNQVDIHVNLALCFPFLTSKAPGIIVKKPGVTYVEKLHTTTTS